MSRLTPVPSHTTREGPSHTTVRARGHARIHHHAEGLPRVGWESQNSAVSTDVHGGLGPLPDEQDGDFDMWKHEPESQASRSWEGLSRPPTRDFPGVQWLGPWASSAGGLGLIPGQGTRSHMPQLKLGAAKKKKQDHLVLISGEEMEPQLSGQQTQSTPCP